MMVQLREKTQETLDHAYSIAGEYSGNLTVREEMRDRMREDGWLEGVLE